jgi:hypothetical protein
MILLLAELKYTNFVALLGDPKSTTESEQTPSPCVLLLPSRCLHSTWVVLIT